MRAFSIGRLLYTGTKPKPEAEKIQGEFVDFDKLLRESDVVIACASLNEKTKHLFNKEAFSKMKKTAIFINTSRFLYFSKNVKFKVENKKKKKKNKRWTC